MKTGVINGITLLFRRLEMLPTPESLDWSSRASSQQLGKRHRIGAIVYVTGGGIACECQSGIPTCYDSGTPPLSKACYARDVSVLITPLGGLVHVFFI